MASVSDIATVRQNVNESTNETYSDEVIGAMVDASDVAGATAAIWRQKAARYAELVDVTESGSSHRYSDLHKNALAMAKSWDRPVDELIAERNVVRVKRIERS